jgi:hypothetical protein
MIFEQVLFVGACGNIGLCFLTHPANSEQDFWKVTMQQISAFTIVGP